MKARLIWAYLGFSLASILWGFAVLLGGSTTWDSHHDAIAFIRSGRAYVTASDPGGIQQVFVGRGEALGLLLVGANLIVLIGLGLWYYLRLPVHQWPNEPPPDETAN